MPNDLESNVDPDLTIIIVSWNVRELLRSCLLSINKASRQLKKEVIVVDSGSIDGSPEMVRQDFPEIKLLAERENVGFPKGNNLGIAAARSRYILLLNPDTQVVNDALGEMHRFMEENADVGVVAGQLLNPDGTVQSSRRRFPTTATGVFESTWLQPLAPRSLLARYYFEDVPNDRISDIDWVVGACMFVRAAVISEVGLLDEDYFMYSEELDWCRRIKTAGWRVIYFPAAKIIHHVGKSSEQAVVERHINFQRAKLRYYRKYHGLLPMTIIRIVLITNYLWQMIVESLKGLFGHKRQLRWQRVRAYWIVIRSGLPPAGY